MDAPGRASLSFPAASRTLESSYHSLEAGRVEKPLLSGLSLDRIDLRVPAEHGDPKQPWEMPYLRLPSPKSIF